MQMDAEAGGGALPQFTRYAVYFTPPTGPLADFGARWLGWDVARGRVAEHPQIAGLPMPAAQLTETPRKYGFHATLKPPMRLETHATPEALEGTLEALCSELAPVALEGLAVTRLGHFVALTPVGQTAALNALAGKLVTGLDHFRAPPNADEMARRRKAGLTERQDEMLVRWGYPYVLDEFSFHMTLSGRITAGEAEALEKALTPSFARLLPGRVTIEAVTLVGEGRDGRFRTIKRFALGA